MCWPVVMTEMEASGQGTVGLVVDRKGDESEGEPPGSYSQLSHFMVSRWKKWDDLNMLLNVHVILTNLDRTL